MGHEIVVYRERHAIIHDLDFWALRHFLLTEAEATRCEQLASFVRGWEWIGPGVYVGDDFDEFFAGHSERESQFVELLSGVARRLRAFGNDVPLDYLQEHVNSPMARFTAATPVERWLQQIEKIRALFPRVRRAEPPHPPEPPIGRA